MFEKEAEEYQTEKRKTFSEHEQLCWGDVYKDWKNGAEFGYNKANEWHYVKDGDLPKEDIYLVIRLNDENTCYKCCTGFWEKKKNVSIHYFVARLIQKILSLGKKLYFQNFQRR